MHDTERKRAQKNEKSDDKTLIKNGKYFVAPRREGENFKRLFAHLAASGAGRPVDKDGFADGPWTPESLADAISAIDGNRAGIELRSVQVWFQDNHNGISDTNIRWLARIFGCGDPEATSLWQAELKAAKDRLSGERREQKTASTSEQSLPTPRPVSVDGSIEAVPMPLSSRVALGISRLIASSSNLYLLIFVWAGWAVLAVFATLLGLGDVSYKLDNGSEKHVGFYRSPTWTVEKLVLIPLFLAITSRSVMVWHSRREHFEFASLSITWEDRIAAYKLAFFCVIFVSVFIVFGLQWYGSYLGPLLDGTNTHVAPNWLRVTSNPVVIAPQSTAVAVSLIAGVYIGAIYWLCFSALLLLYISAHDFVEAIGSAPNEVDGADACEARVAAHDLIIDLYRSIVCGILISMMIKVSVVYLDTDGVRFELWIMGDALHALGYREQEWHWSGPTQLAKDTSFMFLLAISSVAYLAIYRIKASIEAKQQRPFLSHTTLWWAPLFMLLGFQSIGLYAGFSLLFLSGLLVGVWQLLYPSISLKPYVAKDAGLNNQPTM